MKKYFLLLTSLFLLSTFSFAQRPLKLEINHKMGINPFQMNGVYQNAQMQDFKVTLLRYYLTSFSITHDGGQETSIPDTLVYVDVSLDTLGNQLIDLGDFSGTQIEAVSFYMGIEPARNHLDPASYPVGHPLALKNPSNHWGWAAGYFFLSLRGRCGDTLGQWIDLQCLGDENYFKTTVVSPLVTDYTNEVLISIEGDYQGLLQGMDLSNGVGEHGSFGPARDALINANNHVFKSTTTAIYTSVEQEFDETEFSLYPNPLKIGQALNILPTDRNSRYNWVLSDLMGKEIMSGEQIIGVTKIAIPVHQKGLYILSLMEEGAKKYSQKIIIE
jgi:hypothetical protein